MKELKLVYGDLERPHGGLWAYTLTDLASFERNDMH